MQLYGSLILLVGLCLIFDSRTIVKKYLNFGEENNSVLGLKILGFIIVLVGGLILTTANIKPNENLENENLEKIEGENK